MNDQRRDRRPQRRWWGVALAVLVLGAWLVWALWERRSADAPATADPTEAARPVAPEPAGLDESTDAGGSAGEVWSKVLGGPPAWPADAEAPGSCEAVQRRLERACAALDQASYFVGEAPPGGSCAVIERVAAGLARRPPDTTSELRSYAKILDNTFHLFRSLDRTTVQWVRTVVREEDAHVEPLAYALYSWAVTRETCDPDSPVRGDALARYAVFLFRTLGGQAYLHRRSPRTEAMVAFYALLIADRADAAGNNPEGFDPRPEIRRTRELIASQSLALGDDYLRALDEIEIRWDERSR